MASRSQKTRFVKVILQGHIRGQMTGNGPEEKFTNRFAIFWSQNIAYLNGQPQPENQICQGHPSRSNPRSNDWETGQRKNLPTDLQSFGPNIQPTEIASRSQKTRFVKVILQGQIRGQTAGITLEPKVTVRFEK